MCPLDYDNSKEPVSFRAEPGDYCFKVDEIEEKRFGTGNKGLEATLIVDAGGKDITCRYVKFTYTDKSLWKLKEFMESIGLDYHGENEVLDFRGRLGMARFELNEKGYLEPTRFLPQVDTKTGKKTTKAAVITDDDNVPF